MKINNKEKPRKKGRDMKVKLNRFSKSQILKINTDHPRIKNYIYNTPFNKIEIVELQVKEMNLRIQNEFPDLANDSYLLAWIIAIHKLHSFDHFGLRQIARSNFSGNYKGSSSLHDFLLDWKEGLIDVNSISFNTSYKDSYYEFLLKENEDKMEGEKKHSSSELTKVNNLKINATNLISLIMRVLTQEDNKMVELLKVFHTFEKAPLFNSNAYYGHDKNTETRIAACLVDELILFYGFANKKVTMQVKRQIIELLIMFHFIPPLIQSKTSTRKNLSKTTKFDELVRNYRENHVTNSEIWADLA